MSAIISTMPANSQPVRARSPLAANQLLVRLGQAFGSATFTSSQASNALGLDFLYTAKKLFRMRRNNLLNVAARQPRLDGGYENLYRISAHGLRKINYLNSKPPSDLISDTFAAQYLLHGTGTVKEMILSPALVKIASRDVHLSSKTDELGMLLGALDATILQGDIICNHIFNRSRHEASFARSAARATRLQQLGLIPKDMDISTFVANALIHGSSEGAILMGLLVRGSLNLKAEGEESCKIYERMLVNEQAKFKMLEFENDILKDRCRELEQKLGEASLKATGDWFSHWQQLQRAEDRIDRIFEGLVIIAKGLNKFPTNDSIPVLMREFVQDSFIIIALMDRLAGNPCDRTAFIRWAVILS